MSSVPAAAAGAHLCSYTTSRSRSKQLPKELHGRNLYHRCLHFAARRVIAAAQCVWLHFVSWCGVIRSHPGIRAGPSAPCQPACRCPCVCVQRGAQAQFIQQRPRRQMFTIVPLPGLKAPRVCAAEVKLIKDTYLRGGDTAVWCNGHFLLSSVWWKSRLGLLRGTVSPSHVVVWRLLRGV